MRQAWKLAAAAATLAGGMMGLSASANAGIGFGISIGVPGAVAFDYNSGGYCDRFGCPDGYWADPVWYGPVYYGGAWYQGPAYYRDSAGVRSFWVHGGWHRDEWRGPHPHWWSASYHSGPALGFAYYHDHGFHISQHHWDYWHGHGGYVWEHSHGVDWHRDYGAPPQGHMRWGLHGGQTDGHHAEHRDNHH